MKTHSLKLFLLLFLAIACLDLVQNFVLLVQVREANRSLAAIRDATATLREDLQHVKEDVEDNGDAIENLAAQLGEAR